MHNKVVFHAMKALHSFGFPVLRFNFRGTGLSAGQHDEGRGEVADVQAALAWLKQEFSLPIIFAGFSFGAATGLAGRVSRCRRECLDFDWHAGRGRGTSLFVLVSCAIAPSRSSSSVATTISTARTMHWRNWLRKPPIRKSWYSFPETTSSKAISPKCG